MVINERSPIIQNMYGVPNNGTPYYPPNNGGLSNNGATEVADLTGAISQYSYNPATRFQSNFMNPPQPSYGMISSPMMYQNGYGFQPQQQTFGTLGYNPGNTPQYGQQIYNANYQQPWVQQQQYNMQPVTYQDQTYMEPGYNPSNSNMMFASEDMDKLNDIVNRMAEEQDQYRQRTNNVYMGYNYYGNLNTGYNPYIAAKYRQEEYQLQQEAVQRRVDFNKRLSSIAHRYLDHDIDDQYLSDIYDEREVTIPASQVQNHNQVNWLNTFTVDYNAVMQQQYNIANNAISEEYHNKIIDSNCDSLESFLSSAGELYASGMQYEVERAKRDRSTNYDRNGFNRYLGEQLEKRDGTAPSTLFPNLYQSSALLDDGTLQIKAPSWLTKAQKESESSYAQDKQRFIDSIYNPRRT